VEQGELGKTVAKIQGQHAKRIMLVVDEATDTPEAIFKVIPNLEGGCSDLTVLLIGNPISRTLDPFDRSCQPENGWDSVKLEEAEWKAKGDRDLCLKAGLTCRFRGADSPNVKAGKTIYPFLYTYENFHMAKGHEDTIEYWKWTEGFPPPEGVSNTVMSEAMISKYDARGKLVFATQSIPIAGLDPAFGGDRCVLQFGVMGILAPDPSNLFPTGSIGKLGIQLTESVEILPKTTSKDEIDVQIAQQTIFECNKRGVKPEMLGCDATGIGRGVYAFLKTDWGNCVRVEFGGMASEKPASMEDPRPSIEVYDKRVTELWYSCREMLVSGQLKGLYQDAITEFCFRQYEIKSRKTKLETKEEFKKKFGKSPDHADAISVLVEVARQNGAVPGTVLAESGQWEKTTTEINSILDEVEYAGEVLMDSYD
jgi:hypothetical protein